MTTPLFSSPALDRWPLLDEILHRAGQVCDEVLTGHEPAAYRRGRYGFIGQTSNTEAPSFARYGLPYALVRIAGARAILVNRDYKPVGLGIPYSMQVDYEMFPQWIIAEPLLGQVMRARCWLHNDGAYASLYDDGFPPWQGKGALRVYRNRLRGLCNALPVPVPVDAAAA